MNNKELFDALALLETEKGISMDYMLENIQKGIEVACKNYYGGNDKIIFNAVPSRNVFDVRLIKTVVEEVFDPDYEISLEDAQNLYKRKLIKIDDEVGVPLDPKDLGRIAIGAARNTIRQGIRAGEKGQTLSEFKSKLGEIVSAYVEKIDPKSGAAAIRIGKSEAMLPKSEQIGKPDLKEGDYVKVYIADVKANEKGPKAIVSRSHQDLVKRLFEQEVPEIFDGIVEIKSISREAGSRTKMAVLSNNPEVDAIGACIGTKGARVNSIVEELGGEKIDIIEYNEDPAKYISAAIAPAKVVSVVITDLEGHNCKVTVPDSQLSLAIGNKGQNARLAARLTGWRIDIRPESGFFGEEEETISDTNVEDTLILDENTETIEVTENVVEEVAENIVEETAEKIVENIEKPTTEKVVAPKKENKLKNATAEDLDALAAQIAADLF